MSDSPFHRLALASLTAAAAFALGGCVSPGVTATVHRDAAALQTILDRPGNGGEDVDNILANAVTFDCVACARAVLKSGAKATPDRLAAAALGGHEEMARLLIAAGADPATAMAVVHGRTQRWRGGSGVTPEIAQRANDLFKKLERERDAAGEAAPPPVPALPPQAAAPAAAGSAPIAPAFHEDKRPDDYALVVGVEAGEGMPPAAFAERDAASAAEFFKALGVPASHVALLSGARATRATLAKYAEGWLADEADRNSTVYFYFAGRGEADPKDGQAYLLPCDGDPLYPELTGYPLQRLYEKLGDLKAKRAVILLDAGFSGTGARSALARGAKPAAGKAEAGFNSADGKVALLSAADAGQEAGVDDARGHGLFTAALLDGLNADAKDSSGQATLKALFDFAKPRTMDGARRAGKVQTPLYQSGGSATDRVLLRAK